MAFPTTSVLTSFTGTDENPLSEGGNWSGPIISGENAMQRVSNTAKASTTSANNNSYWTVSTYGADVEAYATLGGTGTGNDYQVFARVLNPNSGTMSGYSLLYREGGAFLRLRSWTSGAPTTLGTDITISALANGDKIGIEIIGSTLTAYTYTGGSWASKGTRTDSTYSAAGYIGISINDTGPGGSTLDDFGGGTISGGGPSVDQTFPAMGALAYSSMIGRRYV